MSKKVLILGGGESGVGAAILAKHKGFETFLSDAGSLKEKYRNHLASEGILFEEKTHSEKAFSKFDMVIKSPGIPENASIVKHHRDAGTDVISEIEFAAEYTKAKLIAITGTNGKTTTTLLTYHLLKKAGLNVGLAGNVGKSFALQVAQEQFEYYVLELSSFQLDGIKKFKADIAVLLNITPDHLERYDYKLENYVASKFLITKNQTENDAFIFNVDDEIVANELKQLPLKSKQFAISIQQEVEQGADVKDETITIKIKSKKPITMSIHELALQGKHNIYNSMAASVAGRILELRKDIIRESLSDFQNIEHRLESVTSVCGVQYINDSKATNVNSAWYALESIDSSLVWIVGGVDKGNDYTALLPLVKQKVKAIICLGVDNKKLLEFFGPEIELTVEAKSMREAVSLAYRFSNKGETVLLSPACASFDLFENYEDRGRQFKEAVRSL